MRLTLRILSLLLVLSVTGTALGASQRKVPAYEKYIKQYSSLAIQHQKKYRIPASITLAQGLLESGAGRSELVRKSNNHFGIKCHSDWRGGRVYHDDDLRGECFRKYKNPEQSYEDHARFLVDRPRYASLFKLKITDYKGWARGLQKCGYATDRAYANRLIKRSKIMTCTGMTRQKAVKSQTSNRHTSPAIQSTVQTAAVCLFQRQRQLRRHSRQSRLPGKRPEEIQRGAGRFSVTEK